MRIARKFIITGCILLAGFLGSSLALAQTTPAQTTVSIRAMDAAAEGQRMKFRVELSSRLTQDVDLNWSKIGGTASEEDFVGNFPTGLSGVVTIREGRRGAAIRLSPRDDTLREGDESLTLQITASGNPPGGQVQVDPYRDTATGWILDNDSTSSGPPAEVTRVWLRPFAAATEGERTKFRVELAKRLDQDVELNWRLTADSTADADDLVDGRLSGTVVIPEGRKGAPIPFTLRDDTRVEGNETLVLTISDPGNLPATVVIDPNRNTATKQILDNDTEVEISGKVTFDLVPHHPISNGLSYFATRREPARGVTVEALDENDTVLAGTQTNHLGDYALNVAPDKDVRIRVKAEMVQTTGVRWDVKVTDNTNNNGLYVLLATLASSGSDKSIRNIHAPSGWGLSSYTSARAAAPFAILDPIYTAMQKISAIDPDVNFPPIQFHWSTRNRPERGDFEDGQIGGTLFRSGGTYNPTTRQILTKTGAIFILGDEDTDTDEYDRHVIVHEWAHYFEYYLSQSDSIGGRHGGRDLTDARVAMSEGFANALAGIILEDPILRNSNGRNQAAGFSFDAESNSILNAGWYREPSVWSIIYDIYDDNDDGADRLSLGLAAIYDVLTADRYIESLAFASIFLFIDELKSQQPESAAAIDALVRAQRIHGTDEYGSGETNHGGSPFTLPVYKTVTVNADPVEICVAGNNNLYNGHGFNAYLRLNIPNTGRYTVSMTRTPATAPTETEPDFLLKQRNGFAPVRAQSGVANSETLSGNFPAGEYSIAAWDYNKIANGDFSANQSCFNFSATESN